jgi:hypothetical protein
MNATLLYRIAAALLLLFAVIHTYGLMGFKPATAEGLAVRDAMNSARLGICCCPACLPGSDRGLLLGVARYSHRHLLSLGGVVASCAESLTSRRPQEFI